MKTQGKITAQQPAISSARAAWVLGWEVNKGRHQPEKHQASQHLIQQQARSKDTAQLCHPHSHHSKTLGELFYTSSFHCASTPSWKQTEQDKKHKTNIQLPPSEAQAQDILSLSRTALFPFLLGQCSIGSSSTQLSSLPLKLLLRGNSALRVAVMLTSKSCCCCCPQSKGPPHPFLALLLALLGAPSSGS